MNHDEIEYEEFAKDIYEPAPEVLGLTEAQVRRDCAQHEASAQVAACNAGSNDRN